MFDRFKKDPLHKIIEHHLLSLHQDNDEKVKNLVDTVIRDYIKILKMEGIHCPEPMRAAFIEDLREEVRDLTIKKTFGRVSPEIPKVYNKLPRSN